MKLLCEFTNELNNITYKTYLLDNGVKLLHLVNPATIDSDVSIIFRAGSAFEIEQDVPMGTAHFLEHMLLNPNEKFKTREEIDTFEMGNRNKASIYMNAYTSKKYLYLTGHSNQDGFERILERFDSILEFPKEVFATQMEKERSIILAERSRKPKQEKDPYLLSLKFLLKDVPEFQNNILGEPEDIKKINIDHLEKYFNNRFTTGNSLITIQTEKDLTPEIESKIYKIAEKLPQKEGSIIREYTLENKLDIDIFEDDRATGTSISIIYFLKEPYEIDYKSEVVQRAAGRLIDWLGFNILREEKHLVYEFNTFKILGDSFYNSLNGIRFTTENSKIEDVLEQLNTLLYEDINKFLDSEKGLEWFEDFLSTVIYPRTSRFNGELGERVGVQLFESDEILDENKLIQAAKELTLKDLKKYLTFSLEIPPHFWVETDNDKEKTRMYIRESNLFKNFLH